MPSKKELALTREQVLGILELRFPEYEFYWKVAIARNVKAGSKAGRLNKDGYTVITIDGSKFKAHRLVWFVTYGEFPDNQIDHLDGNPSNNRIENLRDVSNKTNGQNRKKRKRLDEGLPTGIKVGKRNKIGEIIGYYASWYDINGKRQDIYFGIKKWLTLGAALAASIARRELEMTNLLDLGAAYTDRHGCETAKNHCKDAEWQPIETAPKDYVTEFDGWNGERVTNISWEHPAYSPKGHFAWCVSEYVAHHGHDNVEVKGLTHWMPLPKPPAAIAKDTQLTALSEMVKLSQEMGLYN